MERPQRPPPNPYYGLPLEEVTVAMHRRASQLQARTPRTPEERLALAEDTAYLLLTAAAALDPGTLMPHQPEEELRREGRTL
ncbi:MAG: hypothetical protein HOQ02_01235, partial [Lysobacter sp.]|nr:hypothetical protein [Lysobacter sp.]